MNPHASRFENRLFYALLALLVWFVYAPQCVATLAAVRRETGHWRHALGVAAYLFALAYLMAWITYRVAGAWGAT